MADRFEYKNMSLAAVKVLIEKCKRNEVDYRHKVYANGTHDLVILTSRSKFSRME